MFFKIQKEMALIGSVHNRIRGRGSAKVKLDTYLYLPISCKKPRESSKSFRAGPDRLF